MTKFTAAAVALAWLATTAAADPVHGTWKTEPGDGGNFAHVAIADCGGAVCGTLVKAFNAAGQPISSDTVGKRMIWDMAATGGGRYAGGKIWAPDKNKVYRSKMALSGNALKVSGCVGPICRGQTWTRVK